MWPFNLQQYPPVNPADRQRGEERKGAYYLMKNEDRFLGSFHIVNQKNIFQLTNKLLAT